MKKRIFALMQVLIGIALIAVGAFLYGRLGNYAFVLVAFGLACVALGCVALLLTLRVRTRGGAVYRRRKAMLTPAEADFLAVLCRVVDLRHYDIIYQVALSAVVDKVTQNAYRNELFRTIDFAIVHAKTYAPLLLIELNDASHNRADRQERDRKVAEICEAADMPIVSFSLEQATNEALVRKTVAKNMLKK